MHDGSAAVGARLRAAREGQGLSRADIAARTKIAERHLAAIEESRFGDLASRAYAIGFSRTYARAVGLDEGEIAASLRAELGMADSQAERPASTAYEPVDPSRVPSSRTAWLAGLAAFVLVIAGWLVWTRIMAPAPSLPAPSPASTPAPVKVQANGPVTLTALQQGVWVRVTDAGGAQLFQKEMAQGETWTVPADAAEPSLRTAWPDALQISIGNEVLPPLSQTRQIVSGVILTADVLRARGSGAAAVAAAPGAPVTPPASPAVSVVPRSAPARPAPPDRPNRAPAPAASDAEPQPAPAVQGSPGAASAAAPTEASTETD